MHAPAPVTPAIPTDGPIGAVLLALKNVRGRGGAWTARCPAHEDRSPSLSIKEGHGGRVLLRCHAGCTTEAIVAALGLTMADLFPAELRAERTSGPADARVERAPGHDNGALAPRGQPVLVQTYDYTDEHGTLLFQACRMREADGRKSFRQRRRHPEQPGEWLHKLDDTRRVLYRLPEVLEAVALGRPVFVVEGEKDADALADAGYCATTSPMGAGKWSDAYAEPLAGADVVILPDNDEPGRLHAGQVAASCLAVGARVRVVALPGLPPKGDVSDWLAAGHDLDAFDRVVAATPRTRPTKAVWRLDDLWADEEIMRPPPPIVPYLAWAGRSTLLASAEKAGKSTLTGFVAACVSTGARFLDEPCERGTVLCVGLEEFIGDAARRLRQFRADPTRIFLTDRLPGDPRERPHALRRMIEEVRPVLVIVDSLIAYSDGAVSDASASAQMGPLVNQFTTLAHETGAALVLIHHARKADGKYRDSSAIGGAVDLIAEMFAPDEDTDPRKRVLRARGRVPTRDVAFHYVEHEGRGTYVRAAGTQEATLESRVLAYVASHPRVSLRQVRRAVTGNAAAVDAAVATLVQAGRLVDYGHAPNHEFAAALAYAPGAGAPLPSDVTFAPPVSGRAMSAAPSGQATAYRNGQGHATGATGDESDLPPWMQP
jgi:putative DNA primase/helicase